MKGVVFTEFLGLVHQKFGEEMVDRIIVDSNLPSGGAYTTVGTYDHSELVALVINLSVATKTSVPELLKMFGEHLFAIFARRYAPFLSGITSSFELLSRIEAHIHVDVKKLYPDAELPSIVCDRKSEDVLEVIYHSTRPLAEFAEGLMHGVIKHYGESIEVRKMHMASDGTYVRFELEKS